MGAMFQRYATDFLSNDLYLQNDSFLRERTSKVCRPANGLLRLQVS